MNQTLELLRVAMAKNAIDVYLVFNTDPHQSEYIAEDFMTVKKITNFSGDNAYLIITQNDAKLYTDSRFEISGRKELENSQFDFQLQTNKAETIISEFIKEKFNGTAKIGFDGKCTPAATITALEKLLPQSQINYQADLTPYYWTNKPTPKLSEIFILDEIFCGQTTTQKIKSVVDKLKAENIEIYIVSQLDETAWLLNLRASDIDFCPVFRSFLTITDNGEVSLYIHKQRLKPQIEQYLLYNGINIYQYNDIYASLEKLNENLRVGLDIAESSYKIYSSINPKCQIFNKKSPLAAEKAIKNSKELQNIKKTMIEDGVALEKFFYRLEKITTSNKKTSELETAAMLYEERSKRQGFLSESFECISSVNAHAAMPHYAPSKKTDIIIEKDGIYLVDSGGQYYTGTTDITRVVPIGNFNQHFKRDYTLVFKGMADVATLIFPQGTSGNQIDTIARRPLWQYGKNFGHGTGHGVGFCLNVHEGPCGFSPKNNTKLTKGMVITDEPGIYIENEYGIRIENMLAVVESEFNGFLKFEVLTLCHIDTKAIDKSLLTTDEITFLNNYHQNVLKKLSPHLTPDEQKWLEEKCKAI